MGDICTMDRAMDSSEIGEEIEISAYEGTSVPEQRGRAFSAATVAVLRAYHQKVMVGTGRDHSSSISEAAGETGLGEEQVKVHSIAYFKTC